MSRARLLVTGASGFIGGAVLRRAAEAGIPVRGFSRRPSALAGVEFHTGDIADQAAVGRAVQGIEMVVHAAGMAHQRTAVPAAAFDRVNALGTRVVCEAAAAAGVRHLVLVSSVAVYGRTHRAPGESTPATPDSPYGLSKLAAEREARATLVAGGPALTILRPATVIGPGDPGSVAALCRLLQRGRFVWVGDGSSRRTLIDVGDLAAACLARVGEEAAGAATYNVGGWRVTMRDLVTTLATSLDAPVGRLAIPAFVARAAVTALAPIASLGPAGWARGRLQAWLADDIYDATKWESRFGSAARTPWPDTLAREAAWLGGHGRGARPGR